MPNVPGAPLKAKSAPLPFKPTPTDFMIAAAIMHQRQQDQGPTAPADSQGQQK